MKSSNNNINNLVNQIIFPPGMEIRKIRKKKKKKSDGKKKAKAALKDALNEYDLALNNAKQQRVNLPEKLGQLPSAFAQINSIREMNNLSEDLRARVAAINSLVQEKRDEPTPEELRMIRLRKLMGLQEPQQQPSEPSAEMPPPIEPELVPVPSISQLSDDQRSEISNIERDIMESQNPAERAKLETRLKIMERARKAREQKEKQAQTEREMREQLADPDQFINSQLQTNAAGDMTPTIIMPTGFQNLWSATRQFYDNLIFSFTQGKSGVVEGEYRLASQFNSDLRDAQDQLRTQFNNFLQGLNPIQRQFLDGDIFKTESETTRQFLQELRKILDTDFKTQFIEHLRSIGMRADPKLILIGAERSEFGEEGQQRELKDPQDEKEKKDFEKKLFDLRNRFTDANRELSRLKEERKALTTGTISSAGNKLGIIQIPTEDELNESINNLITELNNLNTELDQLFESEQNPVIREIYEGPKQEVKREYLKMIKGASKLLTPAVAQADPQETAENDQIQNDIQIVRNYREDDREMFSGDVKKAIVRLMNIVGDKNLVTEWSKRGGKSKGRIKNEEFIKEILDALALKKPELFKKKKKKIKLVKQDKKPAAGPDPGLDPDVQNLGGM